MAGKQKRQAAGEADDAGSRHQKPKRTSAVKKNDISMRTTRIMTKSAARNAALDTTELLQGILVCLPFRQLFVLQRVSGLFQDVINTSAQLQQRMFLKPRQKEEYWTLQPKNPVERGNHRDLKWEVVPTSDNNIGKIQTFQTGTLCPFVCVHGDGETSSRALRADQGTSAYMNYVQSFIAEPGTWRNILLSDPPCQSPAMRSFTDVTIKADEMFKADEDVFLFSNTPVSISGRTLGDLFDTMVSVRFEQAYAIHNKSDVKTLNQRGTIPKILQGLGATEPAASAIKHFEIHVTFPLIFAGDAHYQKMRQEGKIVELR